MPYRSASDRGSVTAELAVTLPVIVLVLALCLNALAALGVRVQLLDQSALAARLLGRGESEAIVRDALGGAEFEVVHSDGLVCVRLGRATGLLPMQARSCALDDEQYTAMSPDG